MTFLMANRTFEELFNQAVLDVVVPVATVGLPSPSEDAPYADDAWLDTLAEETTDRKLAFFDENLGFLLTLRLEHSSSDDDGRQPMAPPINLLAFLAHLQITYDASYITPFTSDAPIVPVRSHSIKGNPATLAPVHPSIFPPNTPNPVPSSTDSDRQYAQAHGTPFTSGVWGDGTADRSLGERFALLWSMNESCWIAVFKMTVQVSFMTTKVPDPLLCLTVSVTLREKPLAATPVRKPLQALIDASGGLLASTYADSPTKLNGEDDEYEQIDITGLDEVNLLEGLAIGSTFTSSPSPLVLPTTRLGSSVRRDVFSLPSLAMEPSTPPTTSSSTTIGRAVSALGSHPTLRKSFRKTLSTISGFRVRMRTVFVPYFMIPHRGTKSHKGQNGKRKSANALKARDNLDGESDSDYDTETVHERELREAGNEEHTVILCVEIENAQTSSSSSGLSSFGFAVESVKVSVSGEGASTHLIAWGDIGFAEPERIFPLFLGPSEQYNLLYAVSFLRIPEADDQFSLARGRGLPGLDGTSTQDLQRAVVIVIDGRPYEISLPSSEAPDQVVHAKDLLYPTPTFPSRWNCVLDLSSSIVSPDLLGGGIGRREPATQDGQNPQRKNEALPTPASPFPPTGPRTSIIGSFGSGGGSGGRTTSPHSPNQRAGTATPTMVAGSKRHTLGVMDTELYSGYEQASKMKPPPSPVNYRSGTAMLNPANQRDPHQQTGTEQNVINAQAAAAATQAQVMQNPILGPSSASSRTSYLPPSMAVQTYAKSPTTYGPLSPPLPPTPGFGRRSFASVMPQFQPRHGMEDSISSFISTDSSFTFTTAVPQTPAYPAYPASPPPTSPTGRQQQFWQKPIAGGLQGGASVGPSVEIGREKTAGMGIPPTPGPRVGPGVDINTGGQGGFAQMQDEAFSTDTAEGSGEPIVVSVGLLRLPKRGSTEDSLGGEKIYPLDQFTLDIFVFNQSSWTRRFELSYPDRRKRRKEQANLKAVLGINNSTGDDEFLGVIPLENRVRVGPLLPSTCQSVRMDFLALSPGVHAIDTLTLMDIQSGYTMDLKSVIDIVVHENEIPPDPHPKTRERQLAEVW